MDEVIVDQPTDDTGSETDNRKWDAAGLVEVERLIDRLDAIVSQMRESEEMFASELEAVHPNYQASAKNLVRYLSLRSSDMRGIQEQLSDLGLSSLGRSEADVLSRIQLVRRVLHRIAARPYEATSSAVQAERGRDMLKSNTAALLGPEPQHRSVRIMVTLPSEAADDYLLVREMLEAGMDCVRINCGHDDAAEWARMVAHVRQATLETGKPCRIQFDLAGVKLRTGPMEPGPRLVHWRPRKNLRGEVTSPARVWLAPPGCPPPEGSTFDVTLPVEEAWLSRVRQGDRVRFRDSRGKKRTLDIVGTDDEGRWGEATASAYVETGTVLTVRRKPKKKRPKKKQSSGKQSGRNRKKKVLKGRVAEMPAVEQPIALKKGDTLVLDHKPQPGTPAVRDDDGSLLGPARVACTSPEVFSSVRVGEAVKLNDGKIEGVLRAVSAEEIHIDIIHAKADGSKLRADRSINFPESRLRLSGLTPKDLTDLGYVAHNTDIIGLSFVNEPADVVALQSALAELKVEDVGIVLKIETKSGFEQLPSLMLAAMRTYPVGVMIARGDLAVECGWERMAEVQEEILWLCEAAHVPVIWATQVLERLAQRGLPSRPEITDAAMGERAECVMLNKGPFIMKAIKTLDDVLRRMQNHQLKKTSLLRRLQVSDVSHSAMRHDVRVED